jgi:ppGpp synthetase/RelA/SpoT-type nucleotidyltranferase
MTYPERVAAEAVARYSREYDRYLKLTARVAEICRTEVVEAHAIRAQVTSRTKSLQSFEAKLRRLAQQDPAVLQSIERVFETVRDLSAVRVTTFERATEPEVIHGLIERFHGAEGSRVQPEYKDKHIRSPELYYRATHCEVFLKQHELVPIHANLARTPCEVQVCSVLSNAWNEIEHDLRYKAANPQLSAAEPALLSRLGELMRAGDAIVSELLTATAARQRDRTGAFQDVHDFVARMRAWFPGTAFNRHAGHLYEALQLQRLDSPQQIAAKLADPNGLAERSAEVLTRLSSQLHAVGHRRYELEPASSDLLLVALLPKLAGPLAENYADGRLARIAWLAARYLELHPQP